MASWQNIISSSRRPTPFIKVNISNETKLLIESSSINNSNTPHIDSTKGTAYIPHNPLGTSTAPKTEIYEFQKVEATGTPRPQPNPSPGTSAAPISEISEFPKNEPSEHNPLLMKLIRRQPMATDWHGENHKPYVLRTIPRHCSEFRRVNNLFRLSNRGLSIRKLQRIENPFLLGQYLLKRDDMVRRNLPVRERLLFHGTTNSSVRGICSVNFDWRLYGQARGHKYGHGVCFSPEVSYASQFGQKVMILTRVLVAKTVIGNSDTVLPPAHFDTTRNDKGTVLVKYEDAEYYPEYVIRYGRNNSRNIRILNFDGIRITLGKNSRVIFRRNRNNTVIISGR